MENEKTAAGSGVNRAKTYQLVLFPLNNGATNVYYVLILSYIATFGNNVLGIATVFASVMVTGMRVFDAFTDPIIGALMDRTNGKLGKFRPFMLIGNIIMAFAVFMLYCICPDISEENMWLRYAAFIVLYAVWVIGYTFQTSVTRSGQTVLTNDPKQRPLFTIFNTIGSMAGMGLMQFMAPIIRSVVADYSSADFYRVLTPIGVVISFFLTILAIIGIWEKDNPKYFGIGGAKQEKTKASYPFLIPDSGMMNGRLNGISAFPETFFVDKNGNPLVAMHWQHRLNHMVKRYNDIYRVQMPNITPHVCRHTYCSNMAKSGMNPKTLQYLMGHSDIAVTLNVYTHIGLDDATEELRKLEEMENARRELEKGQEKPVSQKMFKAI